jgi:hypothetical protein
MSKGKGPDRPEAARKQKLPPSLNKVPGWSDAEVEKEDCRHRLEEIMHKLPLQAGAAPRIKKFSRDLYETFSAEDIPGIRKVAELEVA